MRRWTLYQASTILLLGAVSRSRLAASPHLPPAVQTSHYHLYHVPIGPHDVLLGARLDHRVVLLRVRQLLLDRWTSHSPHARSITAEAVDSWIFKESVQPLTTPQPGRAGMAGRCTGRCMGAQMATVQEQQLDTHSTVLHAWRSCNDAPHVPGAQRAPSSLVPAACAARAASSAASVASLARWRGI